MGRFRALPRAFYRRPPERVARDLIGRLLIRELDGTRLVLRLVEVEAYLGPGDRASHTWGGRRTERNRSMWLGGGHAYVYFVYGMHFCLNVVCGKVGEGTAVLLRAGEPVAGAARMAELRGLARAPRPGELAGGPGRLCRALGIDRALDGVSLLSGPLRLAAGEPVAAREIVRGPRVGVAYAGEAAGWPLRFALAGSSAVSRPRPREPSPSGAA
jgi:DNA-3-methyladenine glycosylase